MNALRADKSLFPPEIVPARTRSRDAALASAIETPEQLVIHEQAADPMVYRAASELIRLDDEGRKTDIEAQGQVYEVLQSVAEGLKEAGASHLAAGQILGTLADYVSGLGADFARQAKAKPLYARVMVTNREPEDIPECKLQSVTCIDGQRVQGDDAGKMSMTLTLYGTSNAMSQGMSMDRIFESGKKKWLLVYYGTVEGSDLNKFDTVDADLATLMQAVGADGAAAMQEVRQAIEQGTLPPEIMKLVAAVADLNRALEAAKTPGALENPERTIAELKALVAEMSQAVPDLKALPPELIQAAAQSIESADAAFSNPEAVHLPSNDNDTAVEQVQSVLEQIAGLLQDETLPPEIKEELAAFSEEIAASLPERDYAALEAAMAGVRETLVDFAASDSVSPQMFRTVSNILPSVVVAENQIREVIVRPPAAAGIEHESANAVSAEVGQIMDDLKRVAGEKIEIILQDESASPEMRDRLREIAQTMELALESKDFSKLALAVTEIYQTAGEFAPAQSLADSISNARVVAVLAEITPEVLKSLPPDMQQPILEMQRGVFAMSAREAVFGQQLIAIGYDKRHALQDMIENSGLSVTERQKLIRELQGGQASVETLRHIVSRVETTTPRLDTGSIHTEVDRMIRHAARGIDSRTYTPPIDPAIKGRVVAAIAQLPLPAHVIREIGAGNPVSVPVLATVIAAAGETPSPEVKHYIREAVRQVAKEQANSIVEQHKRSPIPGMTVRDIRDLEHGNFISAARMKKIMENPQMPLPVRRKLEEYQVMQNQLAPYVSPKAIQRELVQIQQVLMRTNPLIAKSVETFRQRNPDATAVDVKNYMAAMPEQTRIHFDQAAEYVGRHGQEQGYVSQNSAEVVSLLQRASIGAAPYEKAFLDEMTDRIRMGEPVLRSDLDRISEVARFDIHDYSVFSDSMTPSDREEGIRSICPTPCGGDCAACGRNFVTALEAEGENAGAMASIENSGYDFRHTL